MSQEKESTSGSSKAHKRYVYLNKFNDYKKTVDEDIRRLEKEIKRAKRRHVLLLVFLSVFTIILSLLRTQLTR